MGLFKLCHQNFENDNNKDDMIQCFNNKNPIFRKIFLLAGQIIALLNDDPIENHPFKVTPSGKNETNLEAYVLREKDFGCQ